MDATNLLEWFDTVRRDLPWRKRRDPWAVLVSEIMLQQTQVERVVGYWERFLARFPDVESCADAEVDEVLALWTGLGYYRRGRALHTAARALVADGAPQRWPESARDWRRLPGIGSYTAAALASSCAGEMVAAVDANVQRVVGRWLGLRGSYGAGEREAIEQRAESVLDRSRPGDSNQALIELGALICRPRKPSCGACPLERSCAAAASGEPTEFGPARVVRAATEVVLTVVWVERAGRVLLVRRSSDEGLLDGLWELPWCEGRAEESLRCRYGVDIRIGRVVGRCRHAITFRRISAVVVEAESCGAPAAGVWWPIEQIDGIATSSLVLKVKSLVLGARARGAVIDPRSKAPR